MINLAWPNVQCHTPIYLHLKAQHINYGWSWSLLIICPSHLQGASESIIIILYRAMGGAS